jgi:hypothetical protein
MGKSKYDAAGILGQDRLLLHLPGVLSLAFSVFGRTTRSARSSTASGVPADLFVAVLALVIAAAIAAARQGPALGNMLGRPVLRQHAGQRRVAVHHRTGVFFALDQLQIAPLIVGGIFYALLALIVIPPIIAFGVGGIDPARETIRNMQSQSRQKAQEIKNETSSGSETEEPATAARRTRTAAAAPARRRRPTA